MSGDHRRLGTTEGFCSSSRLPYAVQGAHFRAQASAPHTALCRVCQPQGLTPGRKDCWGLAVYIKIPKTWLPLKGNVVVLIIPTSEGLRGMGMANYKAPGRQPAWAVLGSNCGIHCHYTCGPFIMAAVNNLDLSFFIFEVGMRLLYCFRHGCLVAAYSMLINT